MKRNKLLFIIFAYEESGGTKKLIDDIILYFEKRRIKGTIISIISPSFQDKDYNINRKIIYLNKFYDFNIHRTYQRVYEVIYKINPTHIIAICGHPYIAHIVGTFPPYMQKITSIYMLDPWFVYSELKKTVRSKVSTYIQTRDSIISSLNSNQNASSIFKKTRDLDTIIGTEIYTPDYYKNFKQIITLSTDMQKYIKNLSPQGRINLTHLYTPYNVKLPDISNIDSPKELQLMYIGRITSSWKGFGILLGALKLIKSFKLDIYTKDKFEITVAQQLLQRYNLNRKNVNFHFNASTKTIMRNMSKSTSVIIPSVAEGFSFTMLESMVSGGITIMGPLYGGPIDIIENGKNGFLYKPADSIDLAEKILKIYNLPKTVLTDIRVNAIKTAKNLTFKDYINTLANLLELV